MKAVPVTYIESGAFQGEEEAVYNASINYNEKCLVVKKKDLLALQRAYGALSSIVWMAEKYAESGGGGGQEMEDYRTAVAFMEGVK